MRFSVPLAALLLAVMFSSCSTVQPSADVPVAEESVSGFVRTRYCAKAGEDVRKEAEKAKADAAVADGGASDGSEALAGGAPDSMVPAPELSPAAVAPAESSAAQPASMVMQNDGTASSSSMRAPRDASLEALLSEPKASAPVLQAPPPPAAELRGLRSPQLPTGLPMSLDGKILQQQGE